MPRRTIAPSLIAVFALLVAGSAIRPAATQAGGGCHGPDGSVYTEGQGLPTVVKMDVCSFAPTVVRVPVGATVRFLNTAPNEHAVTGRSQSWGSVDVLAAGAEYSQRFEAGGVYPYACPLHVGMVGAVIVGEPVAAAPVSAGQQAAATTSDTASVSQADVTPVALGVGAGLVGGAIVGLLAAGAIAGRRRSTSSAISTDRARSDAIDG